MEVLASEWCAAHLAHDAKLLDSIRSTQKAASFSIHTVPLRTHLPNAHLALALQMPLAVKTCYIV